MNYRLNKGAIYGVVALVLIAAGIFGYTLISAPSGSEQLPEEQGTPVENNDEQRTIQAQHQYKDGVHTIAGTVDVPTPCHILRAESFFTDESKQQVEIRFTTSVEGDVCAQVVTPARFKVDFEAPEDTRITVTWNGVPANINLLPVPEGQNLEDFDVFLKG